MIAPRLTTRASRVGIAVVLAACLVALSAPGQAQGDAAAGQRIEAKEGETIEAVARGKTDRVRVVAPPKPRYDLSVLDDEE